MMPGRAARYPSDPLIKGDVVLRDLLVCGMPCCATFYLVLIWILRYRFRENWVFLNGDRWSPWP